MADGDPLSPQVARLPRADAARSEGAGGCCVASVAGASCGCADARDVAELVALAAGPFTGQSDLLLFATLLEASPGIEAISLTTSVGAAAHFEVLTESSAALAAALERVPGYVVSVEYVADAMWAHVAPPVHLPLDVDVVVPARPRFRVFRPGRTPACEAPADDATAPDTTASDATADATNAVTESAD